MAENLEKIISTLQWEAENRFLLDEKEYLEWLNGEGCLELLLDWGNVILCPCWQRYWRWESGRCWSSSGESGLLVRVRTSAMLRLPVLGRSLSRAGSAERRLGDPFVVHTIVFVCPGLHNIPPGTSLLAPFAP